MKFCIEAEPHSKRLKSSRICEYLWHSSLYLQRQSQKKLQNWLAIYRKISIMDIQINKAFIPLLYTMLSKQQVLLINCWLWIQQFQRKLAKSENTAQASIFEKHIARLEEKYFELWFDLYRDWLQDKFIAEMVEAWYEEEDIQVRLEWTRFVEWAMEVCFSSLQKENVK